MTEYKQVWTSLSATSNIIFNILYGSWKIIIKIIQRDLVGSFKSNLFGRIYIHRPTLMIHTQIYTENTQTHIKVTVGVIRKRYICKQI